MYDVAHHLAVQGLAAFDEPEHDDGVDVTNRKQRLRDERSFVGAGHAVRLHDARSERGRFVTRGFEHGVGNRAVKLRDDEGEPRGTSLPSLSGASLAALRRTPNGARGCLLRSLDPGHGGILAARSRFAAATYATRQCF